MELQRNRLPQHGHPAPSLTRALVALSASALLVAGCALTDDVSPGAAPSKDSTDGGTPPSSLVAVTTTTPLGDVVDQIAQCGGGSSSTIMGIGDDPHSFQPSSAQVAMMVNAPLVVVSGLGLEDSLLSAVNAAAADGARVLEIGPLINPLTFFETGTTPGHDDHGHDDAGAHADQEFDPHWWLDVTRMAQAAELIGDELAEQTGNPRFDECGAQISAQLLALDEEMRTILSTVPEGSRHLVTDHTAFGYFAASYGFEVVGSVIPSTSTDAEPSSADLAKLVLTIEEFEVPAIFTNTASPETLAKAVAAEVTFDVQVIPLFTESLGPKGSGAETYQEMMRTNATLISGALHTTDVG